MSVKSEEQQAALSMHRTRGLFVKQRTQLVNMMRGLLAEFGIDIPQGIKRALEKARQIVDGEGLDVPSDALRILATPTGKTSNLAPSSTSPDVSFSTGYRPFHEMEHFSAEEGAFKFLYSVAVGVERLLKIAVILTEHDSAVDQDAFEKSLITHTHQELVLRLRAKHDLKFPARKTEFTALPGRFYTSQRYGRYSLNSVFAPAQEHNELVKFLEMHLDIKIDVCGWLTITPNERKHRKFIGRARLIRELIKPLPFDPALEAEYLAALRSDRKKITVLDELESHYYEDITNFKERRGLLEASTHENLDYDEDIDAAEIDDGGDEDDR